MSAKIIPFNRPRTLSVSDLHSDSTATIRHNLPNPKAFFRSIMVSGIEHEDPFSMDSKEVHSLFYRFITADPNNFGKGKSVLDVVRKLDRNLLLCAKTGLVALLCDGHPSIGRIDLNELPTASAMLSKKIEIDFISYKAERNFVYSLDELKVIYVSLLRVMGIKAFLIEFEVVSDGTVVPPYVPVYPYSSMRDNERLGVGVLDPAPAKADEFDSLISFSPTRNHPSVRRITALNDYESSGIIYGLRAERRLNHLKYLRSSHPNLVSTSVILSDIDRIVLDIREAYHKYPTNSVALTALVKTMAFVAGMIEDEVVTSFLLQDIATTLGISEEINLRFKDDACLKTATKEQGLRKKLLLGDTDIPHLASAFILGLCLGENSKSAKDEIQRNL